MTFRSLVPNAVLLYAADNPHAPEHFISLELVNGQLVFQQNSGAGTVRVASRLSNYSDGGIEYTVSYRVQPAQRYLAPENTTTVAIAN